MTLLAILIGTLVAGIGSVWLAAWLSFGVISRYTQHMLSLAAGALLATAFLHLLPEAFESDVGPHALFLTLLLGLVFFFLILWGYNYQRTPIFQQLSLKPKALNLEQLESEVNITLRLAEQYRKQVKTDTLAITEIIDYPDLENLVRANMSENMEILGLNFTGKPRTKQFPPPGFMRKMGILGIYFPFTGESYIDPTLHPLEKPFTIAARRLRISARSPASHWPRFCMPQSAAIWPNWLGQIATLSRNFSI